MSENTFNQLRFCGNNTAGPELKSSLQFQISENVHFEMDCCNQDYTFEFHFDRENWLIIISEVCSKQHVNNFLDNFGGNWDGQRMPLFSKLTDTLTYVILLIARSPDHLYPKRLRIASRKSYSWSSRSPLSCTLTHT